MGTVIEETGIRWMNLIKPDENMSLSYINLNAKERKRKVLCFKKFLNKNLILK